MSDDITEFARHFTRVFDARDRAAEGDYCTCAKPERLGTICTVCGRRDRSYEVEQVLAIVSAHDFEPDDQHPEMCHVCTNWETHRRHQGQNDIGRLRDGTPIDPAAYQQAPHDGRPQ